MVDNLGDGISDRIGKMDISLFNLATTDIISALNLPGDNTQVTREGLDEIIFFHCIYESVLHGSETGLN